VARPSREELEAENASLRDRVGELESLAEGQAEQLKKLGELVERLRRQGKRQSAPFSKGEPTLRPGRGGRKKGEFHGRHGHRPVPPVADREIEVPLPGCCPDCGGDVELDRWADQFHTELPEPRPVVTRFKVGVGHCTRCRRRVQGRHAEQTSDALGAAGSMLGPHARALGHWLHYVLGLSFGKTAKLLGHFGVPVTAGALASGAQATGRALVPTNKAITLAVGESKVVVIDETGWRVAGWGAWLWVATTPTATVYKVAEGRRFEDATTLVPADYQGTIVRDGYVVYRNGYTAATHQTCLAHLLRRTVEMIEADVPNGRRFPRQIKTLLTEALAARDLPAPERNREAARIGDRVDVLTAEIAAAYQPCDADRRLAKHLGKERSALLTFLTDKAIADGVDATNWRAEQGVRPAVVNRKVWGGNRTWGGAATQSRMMTFFRTAVQRGADPIDLLIGHARAPDVGIIPGLGLT